MSYRTKAGFILKYKPDIVVVPECEHPDKLKFGKQVPVPNDIFWFGTNPNKGLGVFSYGCYRFKLYKNHNPEFKNILPLVVTGGEFKFTLFAIWANNPLDKEGAYVTQVWKALHFYDDIIKKRNTLLVGDFNSNTIWDKPRRIGNHSAVVAKLETKKIFSAYHYFHQQQQGKEKHPTLFMYRHQDKPYHIDYCFASSDLIKRISKVQVGSYKKWSKFSDHIPLLVTFD